MQSDEKIHWAVLQLQKMHEQLGRIPKKDDFDEATRSRIKAFLGPWPRALEAAGLKAAKTPVPRKHSHKRAVRSNEKGQKQNQKVSVK